MLRSVACSGAFLFCCAFPGYSLQFTSFFQRTVDLPIILLSIAVFIAGAFAYKTVSRSFRAFRVKRRFKTGMDGEDKARRFLQRHGFTILKEQVVIKPQLLVDGQSRHFTLRADFLVRRKGIRAIVDAKTGYEVIDPVNPSTRRQLFEYLVYYKVKKLFLYDGVHEKLHEITFPCMSAPHSCRHWLFLAGLIAGLCLSLIAALIIFLYR